MNSPIQSLPLPELYYQANSHQYYTPDDEGKWISVNESAAKLAIRRAGYSDKKEAGISEADDCFLDVQRKQNVAYAGRLAGHDAGFYQINGSKVLVTESPKLITPVAGEWPLIHAILEGMLVVDGVDQRPHLYGWLKRSLESFYTRKWMQGQVVAFAGPKGAAKSLLQSLLTEMFGGRSAKPYLSMSGRTDFNADIFEGEHLVVDDEAESVDAKARRHFAGQLKQVAVVKNHHCHGKNKQALVLPPRWRMTISLNDDPERMLVLPPITGDIEDKIMLFKVAKRDMPMPTATADEKEAFWNALVAELPAFIDAMLNYEIPLELQCPRFGVKHYHHPELLAALQETAPEVMLLQLLDQVGNGRFDMYNQERTALDIQRLLQEQTLSRQAEQLLKYANSCGNYLSRLCGGEHPRVTKRILHGVARYTILPPAVDPADNEPVQ
jgi:hypothetical protein